MWNMRASWGLGEGNIIQNLNHSVFFNWMLHRTRIILWKNNWLREQFLSYHLFYQLFICLFVWSKICVLWGFQVFLVGNIDLSSYPFYCSARCMHIDNSDIIHAWVDHSATYHTLRACNNTRLGCHISAMWDSSIGWRGYKILFSIEEKRVCLRQCRRYFEGFWMYD